MPIFQGTIGTDFKVKKARKYSWKYAYQPYIVFLWITMPYFKVICHLNYMLCQDIT